MNETSRSKYKTGLIRATVYALEHEVIQALSINRETEDSFVEIFKFIYLFISNIIFSAFFSTCHTDAAQNITSLVTSDSESYNKTFASITGT